MRHRELRPARGTVRSLLLISPYLEPLFQAFPVKHVPAREAHRVAARGHRFRAHHAFAIDAHDAVAIRLERDVAAAGARGADLVHAVFNRPGGPARRTTQRPALDDRNDWRPGPFNSFGLRQPRVGGPDALDDVLAFLKVWYVIALVIHHRRDELARPGGCQGHLAPVGLVPGVAGEQVAHPHLHGLVLALHLDPHPRVTFTEHRVLALLPRRVSHDPRHATVQGAPKLRREVNNPDLVVVRVVATDEIPELLHQHVDTTCEPLSVAVLVRALGHGRSCPEPGCVLGGARRASMTPALPIVAI